jgi:NADH dehydrogenase
MRLLLTGATGFVGSYVLSALLAEGHTVRCLVRRETTALPTTAENVRGDVTDPASLQAAMEGCEGVVHLVGIIEEHPAQGITFERMHTEATAHVVAAAQQAGLQRFIHMSANGARPDGVSRYQTTKWQAEEHVRHAGFAHWTIFRPSVIFGDPGPNHPEFCTQLARTLIRPFPILPVFGDGLYAMQPIAVEEVAAAFAKAVTLPVAHAQTYAAVGLTRFSYLEILDRITRGMGLAPKPKLHQPVWLVRPVVRAVGRLGLLPITPDQFEMLLDGNTGNPDPFYRDFGLTYTPFTPENLAYLQRV